MSKLLLIGLSLGWLVLAFPARAGLYCSLEVQNELPSQWRGFLLDQRSRRRACPSLGNKSPFQIILFVAKNPKNLARLFVEAMHTLPG